MNRRGKKWTAYEVSQLYYLIISRQYNPPEIASLLGRSVKALEFKIKDGLFFHENKDDGKLYMSDPPLTFFEFYRNLKKKKQIKYVPQKSGWLKKLFSQKARHIKGLSYIPENRRYLIPKMGFQEALEKHEGKDSWWRFSYHANANPTMRSHVYNREEKICKLCSNELSEAHYQAHHSDYDHKCTYRAKKIVIQYEGKERKIPNCEACKKQNEDRFLNCASRLHAVHGNCNKKLAGKD